MGILATLLGALVAFAVLAAIAFFRYIIWRSNILGTDVPTMLKMSTEEICEYRREKYLEKLQLLKFRLRRLSSQCSANADAESLDLLMHEDTLFRYNVRRRTFAFQTSSTSAEIVLTNVPRNILMELRNLDRSEPLAYLERLQKRLEFRSTIA